MLQQYVVGKNRYVLYQKKRTTCTLGNNNNKVDDHLCIKSYILFFLESFQPMAFDLDDISLSSNQDTNWFLV